MGQGNEQKSLPLGRNWLKRLLDVLKSVESIERFLSLKRKHQILIIVVNTLFVGLCCALLHLLTLLPPGRWLSL